MTNPWTDKTNYPRHATVKIPTSMERRFGVFRVTLTTSTDAYAPGHWIVQVVSVCRERDLGPVGDLPLEQAQKQAIGVLREILAAALRDIEEEDSHG